MITGFLIIVFYYLMARSRKFGISYYPFWCVNVAWVFPLTEKELPSFWHDPFEGSERMKFKWLLMSLLDDLVGKYSRTFNNEENYICRIKFFFNSCTIFGCVLLLL